VTTTSEINPTFDHTTSKEIQTSLAKSEALAKNAEILQNALAEADRRNRAGKDASDITTSLATAKAQIPLLTHDLHVLSAFVASDKETAIASGDLDYWSYIEERKKHPPISTGFGKLDTLLNGGFDPRTLVIILGAPGGGKTTFTNQMAVHAADNKRPVLYVTSEDIPMRLLSKTLARKGQIDYKDVLRGNADHVIRIKAAHNEYKQSTAAKLLYYLDATIGCDIETVKKRAIEIFDRHKANGEGIIVVDYLQRLARGQAAYKSGNGDVRQAVTILIEELKAMASDLNCCVIALSAQSRNSGYGAGSNSLTSAKESGDIEYTADVLMTIGEDDRVPAGPNLKSRVLHIAKNRQGEEGAIALDWFGSRQQFTVANAEPMMNDNTATNGRGKKR